VNAAADTDPHTLRISVDAKATVALGPFARGGKSRVPTQAVDHDFQPVAKMTPIGILMPQTDELFVTGVTSTVTSDCLMDRIEDWWRAVGVRFRDLTTLVLNLDNGPENHSRRTQFMHRLVGFADATGLTIKLAYYPPYHSKYNPIERCWGILERHWNGNLMDELQVALDFIETMTWKGLHPVVDLSTQVYPTGVALSDDAMTQLEARLARDPQLGKWFLTITPQSNLG
jgi:Rhodopirellula transposase DDE domain